MDCLFYTLNFISTFYVLDTVIDTFYFRSYSICKRLLHICTVVPGNGHSLYVCSIKIHSLTNPQSGDGLTIVSL